MPPARSWIRDATLLLVAYLGLSLVVLHPISNALHLATASYPGDARLNIWTLAWVNHVLENPGLALFDANIFYPAPETFAYSEHLVGIALFSFPIYAVTHNPTLAYSLVWFGAFVLNGVVAHLLVWRLTRNHIAALVGGVGFAFSFFNMLHGHGHIQLVWSFWMPLSMIAIDGWVRKPSWPRAMALAVTLVMQVLASWYMAVLVLLLAAAYVPFAVVFDRHSRPRIGRLGVQSLAIAVLLLMCVVPFARHYVAFPPGPTTEAATLSADLASYLVPSQGTWLGAHWPSWLPGHPREPYGESTLFAGYVRLLLTVVGLLWVCWRGRGPAPARGVRGAFAFACLLIVLGGWLSLGPRRPELDVPSLYDLFVRLPGMQLFRAPGRFALLVTLGTAITSAVGALAMLTRWPRAGQGLVLVLLAASLGETYFVRFPGGRPQPEAIPRVYALLRDLGPGAVVSLPFHTGTAAWWREADYQYYSTVHWRPIVNGYSRREPEGFHAMTEDMAAFPGPDSAKTMRRMGVRYVVVHTERYEDGAQDLSANAERSGDFSVIARDGRQVLYAVRPGPEE
jgi:hypothetical protein